MIKVNHQAIKSKIDRLNHKQLIEVANFIDFLQFRQNKVISKTDLQELSKLSHQEFAEEDRQLAEAGISDYNDLLKKADD